MYYAALQAFTSLWIQTGIAQQRTFCLCMQCYKSALKDAIRFFRQWRMAIQEAKALEMVRRISALMAHFTCLRKDTLMESFPLSQYSISSRNRVRSWRKHGSVLLVFCAPKDRLNRAYFEVMLMHTVPGAWSRKGHNHLEYLEHALYFTWTYGYECSSLY